MHCYLVGLAGALLVHGAGPLVLGHGPALSVHLTLPLCGTAALVPAVLRHGLGALAVFLDDFLLGLRVNVVIR